MLKLTKHVKTDDDGAKCTIIESDKFNVSENNLTWIITATQRGENRPFFIDMYGTSEIIRQYAHLKDSELCGYDMPTTDENEAVRRMRLLVDEAHLYGARK